MCRDDTLFSHSYVVSAADDQIERIVQEATRFFPADPDKVDDILSSFFENDYGKKMQRRFHWHAVGMVKGKAAYIDDVFKCVKQLDERAIAVTTSVTK